MVSVVDTRRSVLSKVSIASGENTRKVPTRHNSMPKNDQDPELTGNSIHEHSVDSDLDSIKKTRELNNSTISVE